MSEYIHKSHNVTVLLYHLLFPAKYRRAVFDEAVDAELKSVCLEIEERYQVKFLEIGTDNVSRPAELPRQPLAEPYVTLSYHTAPITESCLYKLLELRSMVTDIAP